MLITFANVILTFTRIRPMMPMRKIKNKKLNTAVFEAVGVGRGSFFFPKKCIFFLHFSKIK